MENNWILPEVRVGIEALKKYRRHRKRMEERLLATELSSRHVPADAALRAEDTDGILLHGAPCRSLFGGAGGQQFYTVAPRLADAGADTELAERIKSDDEQKRFYTIKRRRL
jgi:hypothetical protein